MKKFVFAVCCAATSLFAVAPIAQVPLIPCPHVSLSFDHKDTKYTVIVESTADDVGCAVSVYADNELIVSRNLLENEYE